MKVSWKIHFWPTELWKIYRFSQLSTDIIGQDLNMAKFMTKSFSKYGNFLLFTLQKTAKRTTTATLSFSKYGNFSFLLLKKRYCGAARALRSPY